jgi:hypothetical protein
MVLWLLLGFLRLLLHERWSRRASVTDIELEDFKYLSATVRMTLGGCLVELAVRGAARDGLNGTKPCSSP